MVRSAHITKRTRCVTRSQLDSLCFFFSSRRRHTRCSRDWSSDVCSSDLSSIRRTLRMFLTLFRLRAAGLQRSLNSRSGIKRGRELAPRHKGKELGRLNPQLTTTSSPWESILASSDPSLITITRLFKIRKPQSVAPAPTSSRPCRLRMFSRSKTRPPWQNEWHTLRLNNWRSRPVRLWMRILNRSSNILTRSEEHTSELQSRLHLVCRLLLEKKKH